MRSLFDIFGSMAENNAAHGFLSVEGKPERGRSREMEIAIQERINDLAALCAKYRVRQLALFGSALGEEFDPATSDLDFLVEFYPMTPKQHADSYFVL